MMYSRQKIFSVIWLCAFTLLLAGQKPLFAQTIQSNYGIPDYINVANGSVTFKVKIIGAATPCSAATLDITLPPGHMFVNGSAALENTPGSSGIVSDTSAAAEANSRRLWINNIPQFPGVTELSFEVYVNCSGIGVNNPNISYVLSGCTATPATLSAGMITRNAQLNITQVTNNNIVGPVDTVYERKITLRNDGYGTIDTFYIDSRNQNSLQVVSYAADAGATVTLAKIMAGTDTIYRYKIIKPGSLNNGQTFTITEQVRIANCSGTYLTAIKSWYGINGQECSSVSNNINAGAILASRTSSMAIVRKGNFTTGCRGDVVSDTLILRNNGTNAVINPEVAFSGYNSTTGSIFSWNQSTNAALAGTLNFAINPSSIKYKAKVNGVWQPGWNTLTADSSLAMGSAGTANSCFGANDKIAVWSHMPFTMIANDSVLYVIEGRQCSYTTCSEDATAVTRLDARFRSACGDAVQAVGAGGSYAGRFELQPTDFPLDVVPGETFSLGYYVPSVGHIAPQLYTNGQISFTIDLPAQFNWSGNLSDISFFKGTTNLLPSGTVSYSGNPGGTITFTFTPVTSDNYYIGTSFEVRNITVDPALMVSSSAAVGNGVGAKRKASCPEQQLFCTSKTIEVKAGPGTCAQGGLSVGRIQTRRTNYGAPDALNNGTVNGSLDMNKVKTKYVMTGDTLEVTYWGRVQVTGLSPVFNIGGVTSTYSLHVNKMQPLKSIVSLYNSSAAQVGTAAEEILSFGSGSTANQSSVAFGIADFNEPARTTFQSGDSVVVKKYFRILPQNTVTDNDNTDFIQQVVVDNNVVYLGNTATPAVKYSCGAPLRQWFNTVSLRIAAAEAGTRNAVSCTELDYTLRLNTFVGGSGAPFIFEQRKVFEVSQVRYQYPAGLTYNGTTTGGTPVSATANPLVYNGPFTSYPSVTDESRVNLNLIKPSMRIDGCLVSLPLGPIVSSIDYKKYPDFNTVRTIDLSNTVNSIVKPTLAMTSPLPDLYTSTDSISWVVRLAVNGGANSYNTFLGKSGTSGVSVYNIQRVASISAATGTSLTQVGDVFQAGTINNGVTNFFRVFATTTKCEKDTLQLAYGWDCTGYPASVSAASCKQTFNLSVIPYSPALQLNVIAQGNGTSATAYNLCDTLEYELEVTNSGLGLAHDLAVQMQLPATGGLVFVPGSLGLKYPLSQPAYTVIDDSNVQTLSSSLLSLNIPDNNLPDLSTADKYRIRFKMTFNSCSFSGGSRITFRPVGMKNCQQSVLGTGQSAQRIVLSDAPELIPSFTFASSVDSTTACVAGGASTIYRFKLTNNTFTTTANDGFRITLPDNWIMDTSTINFLNGNVTGAVLDTLLPGNIYDFNIGSGLASAQSVQFTAVLNNTTALACGNLDTIEETGYVQFNAICLAKGLDCTIKQMHENGHNTTIYTQRPSYSISSFTAQAGALPNHLVGAVTIANANTAYIAQNGTLNLYKDANNNGVRDNGDILLGSQSYPLLNLASQTLNYDFTGYVGQVCPLLAVFESCACDTPTAVKPGCDIILKAVADLSLVKTANNMSPVVGSNVIFTLTVSNAGPNAATGVRIKDQLSTAYTFVNATATNGTYNNTTGIWTLSDTLESGAGDTLHIEATVNASGNYTNYAQVFSVNEKDPDSSPGDDSNNQDDDDSITPVAVPVADLAIVKTGPANVNEGEAFNYTLTISNAGPSEALSFRVKDSAINQFTATGISCTATAGTGTCPATISLAELQTSGVIIPSLKKDGVLTLTLTGIAGTSAQQITNIAYVTPAAGTQDPDTVNNTDTAITRINSYVAGNVYNDINGLNGLPSNTVNGTGTNVNNALYVHLLDNNNTVIATQQVQANGTYKFPGVLPGSYTLVLNTSAQPSATPSLPLTWVNTGENLGSGPGSDNPANGMLSLGVGNVNINNANFGIEQPPTATAAAMASRTNPGGNLYAPVSPSVFVTADPAPGAVWFIRLTTFPANASNIFVGGNTYNAATWPANGVSVATINGLPLLPVEVDPIDGNTIVTLPYVSVDQAGKTSDTVMASIPFNTITISGNVFNDINGLNGSPANTVDGAGISFSGLYAVLIDVISDTVMARVPVSATNGSYSFAGLDAGSFGVRITTLPSSTGGLPPAVALPATWLHTGEHLGNGAGNDGFADGILYIGIKDVDVTDANFGIEQPPVATSDTADSQVNPGGTISVTVPAATFVTSDPTPGAVSTIVIGSLPANANSISIGGTTYTTSNPLPPGGVSIPVNAAGQPLLPISVDPVNGQVTVGISYYVTDEAGKVSDTATAYLPFTAISITGNVYHDANGLQGQPVNTIDGTGTNAGNLKAVLVRNNNNTIVAVTDVAANGSFAFENVNAGDYRIVITTTVNGNQNPAILLPSGWVSTGEYTGTGAGNDGTADGSVNLGSVNGNVSNVRFGIEQLPEAYDIPVSFQLNPGGAGTTAVSTLNGNDPEDGTKGSGNTFVIVTLPAQGTLYYNGQAVTGGDTLHNYNPASLTVDPADGNASISFQYSVVDTAGFADPSPATVVMNFIAIPMNGNVYHDANGVIDNTVNGTGQGMPSGSPLYANLVDPQNQEVIASVAVNANGSYQFGTVRPADTLSVQISTLQGTPGQTAPAIQLPQNWVATGEHTGTGIGHDNQPDGMQLVYTGIDYNGVSQVNFGIEQPAVADEKNLNIPSAGLNVAYPLNAMPLSGTDPEDGAYGTGSSNFIFGQQPNCCGSIAYNGVTLQPGDLISNYNPALLSVTFTDIMAQQVIFSYGVTDAAGKQSPLVNYIINTGTILPVDWLYFTAKAEGTQVRLEWSTAREQNNTGFDIERSGDAVSFKQIGHADSKAINGNSSSPLAYTSYDAAPLNGINYYRLKQTDIDGRATYSEVRSVTFGNGGEDKISVYPNPTTEKVYVKIADPEQVKELRLLGVDGRVMYRSGKEHSNNIDMSVYASGTFIIQVELKNGNVSNFNIVKR